MVFSYSNLSLPFIIMNVPTKLSRKVTKTTCFTTVSNSEGLPVYP